MHINPSFEGSEGNNKHAFSLFLNYFILLNGNQLFSPGVDDEGIAESGIWKPKKFGEAIFTF